MRKKIAEYKNQLFVTTGITEIDKTKFVNPQNQSFVKPKGGLWTSPYSESNLSPWAEWCASEQFKTESLNKGVLFKLKRDAIVYVIDTLQDFNELIADFGIEKFPNIPELSKDKTINFEEMSQYFDAIYLTENGQYETRHTTPGLYGWDVESMLILNINAINYGMVTSISIDTNKFPELEGYLD